MNHFGTDGIRGKASEFTKDYLVSIAKAIIKTKKGASIVIGRDTRESGLKMEMHLTEALLDYGAKVTVLGILPSPGVAFLTRKLGADYGVVLSASHNPPEYNGVKLFNSLGEKLSDSEERLIDSYIDENEPMQKCMAETALYHYGVDEYLDFLHSAINFESLAGLRVCLDCANGAAAMVAPKLFAKAGATVSAFFTETYGKKINAECGATYPETLMKLMSEGGYDIGFTYDGDADRVLAVQNGRLFKGDHLLYLHGKAMKKEGRLYRDTIVVTIMTNMGVQDACNKNGIKLLRTDVGDKFVYREMKNGFNIGGEESGHLLFTDYHTTGDGILSSILTARLSMDMNLAKEAAEIAEFPTVNCKLKCDKQAKEDFYKDEMLHDYLEALEFDGRAIVRPSGTESVIRITVEARTQAAAEEKAQEIKKLIEKRLKI